MRAFPVIYARDVATMTAFYKRLGFEVAYQFPPEGEPGYVSLRRADSSLGITDVSSPRELAGVDPGTEPRFELFVYVEDVDATMAELARTGVTVLREPKDMPWGERVGFVTDPEGNPVSVAQGTKPFSGLGPAKR